MSRFYRGRHRAPTHTGRTVARVATAGAITLAPVGLIPGAAVAQEDGFDHDAIIACESGGDADAQNSSSSASGLYQMIDSTWRSVRGSSTAAHAKDASPAEQRAAANRLFAREGYTPWNASRSCWSGKIGTGTKTTVTDADPPKKRTTPTPKRAQDTGAERDTRPQGDTSSDRRSSSSSTVTVRAGDTLSGIVLQRTGSADWSRTYEHNRDAIGADPHLILPGTTLTVVK